MKGNMKGKRKKKARRMWLRKRKEAEREEG